MITSAEQLRHRLEAYDTRADMRLFAQGYMERVLGWVRPAAHFTQLRAGWDAAAADMRQAAFEKLNSGGRAITLEEAFGEEPQRSIVEEALRQLK